MRRLALPLAVLVLALTAPAALAQQDGGGPSVFDQPLPQPPPAETATPEPTTDPSIEAQQQTDRTLLYVIGAGLLVLFVVIGRVITRDARQTLRASGHDAPAKPRDQGPHRHAKQSKAKARARTKAQRAARRHNR
jgi:hypothetical protein